MTRAKVIINCNIREQLANVVILTVDWAVTGIINYRINYKDLIINARQLNAKCLIHLNKR
jgi:hypothetical protein